jgi:hypothetical protein
LIRICFQTPQLKNLKMQTIPYNFFFNVARFWLADFSQGNKQIHYFWTAKIPHLAISKNLFYSFLHTKNQFPSYF